VGAVLVNAYLRGPQDLTMTDGGTPLMREIWTRLGGEISPLACIGWVRPMRPGRLSSFLAQRALRRRLGVSPPRRRSDRAAPTTRRALPPSPFSAPAAQGLTHEPLTPQQLLAHLPDVVRGMRLYPAYDLPYLEWLFNELDAVRSVRGAPIAHLVRDAAAGRTLGWYVYHLMPGGISHVLQVAARERDAGRVLDHLLHHAWVGGTAVVRGRLEARLVEPLSRRKCILHHAGKALIHSRNGDLLDAVASGRGLWTRMDGELWMAFDLLSLERSPVPAAS
jgi:hypothetical protein